MKKSFPLILLGVLILAIGVIFILFKLQTETNLISSKFPNTITKDPLSSPVLISNGVSAPVENVNNDTLVTVTGNIRETKVEASKYIIIIDVPYRGKTLEVYADLGLATDKISFSKRTISSSTDVERRIVEEYTISSVKEISDLLNKFQNEVVALEFITEKGAKNTKQCNNFCQQYDRELIIYGQSNKQFERASELPLISSKYTIGAITQVSLR